MREWPGLTVGSFSSVVRTIVLDVVRTTTKINPMSNATNTSATTTTAYAAGRTFATTWAKTKRPSPECWNEAAMMGMGISNFGFECGLALAVIEQSWNSSAWHDACREFDAGAKDAFEALGL